MEITFRTKVDDVWVDCSNSIFNNTELGRYKPVDRKKILFNLRPFTPLAEKEIVNRLMEKKSAKVIDLDDDSPLPKIDIDRNSEEYADAVIDHIIKDWEGIVDQDNNPIPCTLKHKIILFEGYYPILGRTLLKVSRELVSKIDLYESREKVALSKN